MSLSDTESTTPTDVGEGENQTEVVSIRYRTRVGPGGRISVQSPHLDEGQSVVVEVEVPPTGGRSGLEIIEGLGGHRLFKNAAEVDAYLAEERASWNR